MYSIVSRTIKEEHFDTLDLAIAAINFECNLAVKMPSTTHQINNWCGNITVPNTSCGNVKIAP